MIRPPRTTHDLRLATALLVLLGGCFSEPDPVVGDDGETLVMCVQAPCTASGDATTDPVATSDATGTSSTPADSTSGSDSAGPSSDGASSDGTDDTGPAGMCGNGAIDQPTEMCDSTPGCQPDCTFEDYECNPLNDAGCVAGLRCGAVDVPLETFGCMPVGAGGLGSPCGASATNDGDCGVGLTCLFNINTPLCDEGNCCVEYCDLTDPTFRCSGGAVCRQFFIDSMYTGLEHLGFCGDP